MRRQTSQAPQPAPEVCVVVPTFNERDNVPILIERLRCALGGCEWEVVFVDDDSPDGTAAVARALGETDNRVRCIRRVGRRGLAGACLEGMLATQARYVAVMDGDLQHDETQLAAMLEPLRSGAADLVVASYMIGEIGEAERPPLAELMCAKTRDTLLVVEPGTPAGYARIIALREQLIASGAHVAAPCPHDGRCPLVTPDWCHFTQRLPRSRAHMHLKGAELPFEDERFSYVALMRAPTTRHPKRVLAPPTVTKAAITTKVCAVEGILNSVAPRRDKTSYQRSKKIRWGDAIFDDGKDNAE